MPISVETTAKPSGACVEFVDVHGELKLFSATLVAIDGGKFKAVNRRDKNFTKKSVKRRQQKTQAKIDRFLAKLDAVNREEPKIREVTAAEPMQKIASMEAKMEEPKRHEAEDESITEYSGRDEIACACLQSQVGNQCSRRAEDHRKTFDGPKRAVKPGAGRC